MSSCAKSYFGDFIYWLFGSFNVPQIYITPGLTIYLTYQYRNTINSVSNNISIDRHVFLFSLILICGLLLVIIFFYFTVIIIIIIYSFFELFPPTLADGFSLDFVTASLLDSPRYSD